MVRSVLVAGLLCGCEQAPAVRGVPDYWRFPPVAEVDIAWVSGNQGQEIALLPHDAAPPMGSFPVPLITGKDLTLRVGLEAGPDFHEREIAVVVQTTSSAGEDGRYVIFEPDRAWDPADPATTVQLTVPGGFVQDGMQVSVSLHELTPMTPWLGPLGDHRWTSRPLDVEASDTLVIHFFPMPYAGVMPDVSDAAIETYRAAVAAEYPVAEVVAVVEEPIVLFDGQDLTFALELVTDRRENAVLAHQNTYFYGLVAGTPVSSDLAGLSNIAGPADAWSRSSVGLALTPDPTTLTVLKHELGHAHGRPHVTCDDEPGPVDAAYPYAGGAVDSAGWDPLTGEAIRGGRFDNMTYCDPSWFADYSYLELLERVRAIPSGRRGVGVPLLRAVVDGAGQGRVTGRSTWSGSGEPMTVVVDGEGLPGWFYPHSHGGGGTVLFDPGADPVAVGEAIAVMGAP